MNPILTSLLLVLLAAEVVEPPSVKLSFQEALRRRETGDFAGAVELLRKVLAHPAIPQNLADHARVALCHTRREGGITLEPLVEEGESGTRFFAGEPNAQAGGDVKPPKAIFKPELDLTVATRRLHVKGAVVLQAVIDREGCVRSVKVLKGVHPEIDLVVEKNSLTWVFQPTRLNDRPADTYFNFVVNAHLR